MTTPVTREYVLSTFEKDDSGLAWWRSPFLTWFEQVAAEDPLVKALGAVRDTIDAEASPPMELVEAVDKAEVIVQAKPKYVVYLRFVAGNGAAAWLGTIDPPPPMKGNSVTGLSLDQTANHALSWIEDPDARVACVVELPDATKRRMCFIRELQAWRNNILTSIDNQISDADHEMWRELKDLGMSEEDIAQALAYWERTLECTPPTV